MAQLAAALLRIQLGHPDRAEAGLDVAVVAAPDDPEIRLARSRLLTELSHSDRAEADFARALSLKSTDPMPWIAHGRWLAGRGEHAQAGRALARAASLTPGELNRFIEAGWWVVGPYPEDLSLACPPEADPDPARAVAAMGGTGTLSWRPAPTGDLGHVDLRAVFGADHISAYALTYVDSPDERPANLMVGGDDAVRVWLNGRLVHQRDSQRSSAFHLDPIPVLLRAGRNVLLVKVSQIDGPHDLLLRIADNPFDRAWARAELGLWNEAASFVTQALDRRSRSETESERMFAPVLLLAGDSSGYRRLCAEMVQRPLNYAFPVLWTCAAAPEGLKDPGVLLRLANAIRDSGAHDTWNLSVQGLARYRAGQYQQALELLRQAVAANENCQPAWPILAMTYHRLGQTEPARHWLKKAEESYESACKVTVGPGPFQLPWEANWWDLALFQVLLREARAQINGSAAGEVPHLEALQARAREEWKRRSLWTAEYDREPWATAGEPWFWLARGRRMAELGRTAEAADDVARAITLAPLDPVVYRMGAAIYARLERWDQAAETFAELLEREPADHWDWYLAAALWSRTGDQDRYQRFCRGMLDRFHQTDDPEIAERTAKVCLLLPQPGPQYEVARGLAEGALGHGPLWFQPYAALAKALADYRGERFADAVATLEQAEAATQGRGPVQFEAPARFVRAMALTRLGRRDEGRKAWEKASQLSRMSLTEPVALDPTRYWVDPLISYVLCHEAEALILYDPIFPTDPFAP
jgi:tetratricopeptide (TPR) repeat protein